MLDPYVSVSASASVSVRARANRNTVRSAGQIEAFRVKLNVSFKYED